MLYKKRQHVCQKPGNWGEYNPLNKTINIKHTDVQMQTLKINKKYTLDASEPCFIWFECTHTNSYKIIWATRFCF